MLTDKLIASGASVIQTSGVVVRAPRIDVDDLTIDSGFSATWVYTASKLENILFTKELHRRYHGQGISSAAFCPGEIATSFGTRSDCKIHRFITTNLITRAVLLTTPDKGAAQLV